MFSVSLTRPKQLIEEILLITTAGLEPTLYLETLEFLRAHGLRYMNRKNAAGVDRKQGKDDLDEQCRAYARGFDIEVEKGEIRIHIVLTCYCFRFQVVVEGSEHFRKRVTDHLKNIQKILLKGDMASRIVYPREKKGLDSLPYLVLDLPDKPIIKRGLAYNQAPVDHTVEEILEFYHKQKERTALHDHTNEKGEYSTPQQQV